MVVLGIIFVVILAIVLITRDGGEGPTEPQLDISQEARQGVSAVYTEQGEVVGQDRRRAIRIVVNQNERRLEILSGYEEAVERASSFPNTQAAFENFLVALDLAGFDDTQPSVVEDERGVCPLGKRYIFALNEFSQPLLESWTTSCSRRIGTFDGSLTTVRKLFEQQIPDYNDQVRGVDLTGTKDPNES